MFRIVRPSFRTDRVRVFSLALFAVLVMSVFSGAAASPGREIAIPLDLDTPRWHTWVLESPAQFRVGAPPGQAETAEEIAQLQALVAERDENALTQIVYWNSGPPAYRWNQIANDLLLARGVPGPVAFRHLALLHAAIYDATVAAWDSKNLHQRPRPSEFDPSLTTVIANPSSSSYPSEYAVTAAAASAVLGWLFPDSAQVFEDAMHEAVHSRLVAGVEYPSDVEAGLELGRQVAELVIARGDADGFSAAWTGSVPTEPGHWTGENPALPTAGTWRTWVLETPDQFRPAPPPAYDSAQLADEMQELRAFERTPVTNGKAMFWEYGAGGKHIHWYWNDVATQLVLAAQWEDYPLHAARVYALANIAAYDSVVACWDAKYAYWAMRPFQYDPAFTPLFATPGHPSYPSAHSCISTAAADVLGYEFPAEYDHLMTTVDEIGEARIWGGIHFRSDIVAGTALGHDVANAVIARAMRDGAQ